MKEEEYKILWILIKHDRVKEIAMMLEEKKSDLTMEVSEAGRWWTFAHLCCQFNAYRSLEILLTKMYFEHPKLYIPFVNAQNV